MKRHAPRGLEAALDFALGVLVLMGMGALLILAMAL